MKVERERKTERPTSVQWDTITKQLLPLIRCWQFMQKKITKATNHIPKFQNKMSKSYQQHILSSSKESFATYFRNVWGGREAALLPSI